MAVYSLICISILIYGSETWQIYSKDTKTLNAFHQKCLRRILKITYKDRITNTDIKTYKPERINDYITDTEK